MIILQSLSLSCFSQQICCSEFEYCFLGIYLIKVCVGCRFLSATVGGLHPTQPPSVRISAVRAVFGFCDHLRMQDSVQILRPYLLNIMEGLVTVIQQFASEVLALCMEALVVVLGVSLIFLSYITALHSLDGSVIIELRAMKIQF